MPVARWPDVLELALIRFLEQRGAYTLRGKTSVKQLCKHEIICFPVLRAF